MKGPVPAVTIAQATAVPGLPDLDDSTLSGEAAPKNLALIVGSTGLIGEGT